jgi:hypothetical protein
VAGRGTPALRVHHVARVPLCPAMAGTAMTLGPDERVPWPEPGSIAWPGPSGSPLESGA